MNATQQLHDLGQCLWLDNIPRGLLTSGTLGRYIEELAAPDTIDTIPEKTLLAFAGHGKAKDVMPLDGGDAEAVLARFARQGVNDAALAADLQREGTADFAKSWNELMNCIAAKAAVLTKADHA